MSRDFQFYNVEGNNGFINWGNAPIDSADIRKIVDSGVSRIISITPISNVLKTQATKSHINITSFYEDQLQSYFQLAKRFLSVVARCKVNGERIFVHCTAGVRTGKLISAYCLATDRSFQPDNNSLLERRQELANYYRQQLIEAKQLKRMGAGLLRSAPRRNLRAVRKTKNRVVAKARFAGP